MKIRNSIAGLVVAMIGMVAGMSIAQAEEKPVVYASSYPLYYFAAEIAGGDVEVRLPEIKGDPAYWAPDGDQVAALQSADLILLNGAGYESWLDFVSLREERLVVTTAGLGDRLLPLEEAVVHQHGPEGEHSHAGTAFTTWLDPKLAAAQAKAIADAMAQLAPDSAAGFQERQQLLSQRLETLDRDFAQAFSKLGVQPVVFSHPVYQYLAERYDINGRSVHWEPEFAPGTRDWIDFQKLLAGHPARLLIWEGEPVKETLDMLEEQGIQSLVFETAGNRPVQGDYFEVMERNRQRLLDQLELP